MILRTQFRNAIRFPLVAGLLLVSACGGDDTEPAAEPPAEPSSTEVVPAEPMDNQDVQPDPGHEVIDVEMTMVDGVGQYQPQDITARTGDVLRFINVENVHNVHFPAPLNPPGATLPDASPYLTNPGQEWRMKVNMSPGEYDLICDPHFATGMAATLTVTE